VKAATPTGKGLLGHKKSVSAGKKGCLPKNNLKRSWWGGRGNLCKSNSLEKGLQSKEKKVEGGQGQTHVAEKRGVLGKKSSLGGGVLEIGNKTNLLARKGRSLAKGAAQKTGKEKKSKGKSLTRAYSGGSVSSPGRGEKSGSLHRKERRKKKAFAWEGTRGVKAKRLGHLAWGPKGPIAEKEEREKK